MSKMGAQHINTGDDRADDAALELAELRAEVETLRKDKAKLRAALVDATPRNPRDHDPVADVLEEIADDIDRQHLGMSLQWREWLRWKAGHIREAIAKATP